jgi:hypothetical protein
VNPSPRTPFLAKLALTLVWLAPVLIMAVLVAACGKISENVFSSGIKSGIIEYKISFPDIDEESITATLLPETMTYAFTESSFASHFETAGGVFQNRIIADRKERTVDHQLKVFRKKIEVKMKEADVLKMLAEYPKATIIRTNEIDTIAGFPCKKALIVFEEVESSDIEVYYTDEIEMDSPNWCTQYHEIEGVLLAYEVVQFGIRMRLEAERVISEDPDPALMSPDPDYNTVTREVMDIELAQLVETFEL